MLMRDITRTIRLFRPLPISKATAGLRDCRKTISQISQTHGIQKSVHTGKADETNAHGQVPVEDGGTGHIKRLFLILDAAAVEDAFCGDFTLDNFAKSAWRKKKYKCAGPQGRALIKWHSYDALLASNLH
jgi:hypothetical protein